MTYVRPRLISPQIINFLFRGIRTFQMIKSGIKEHNRSVRREYAIACQPLVACFFRNNTPQDTSSTYRW